jgi:hypothetical protein
VPENGPATPAFGKCLIRFMLQGKTRIPGNRPTDAMATTDFRTIDRHPPDPDRIARNTLLPIDLQ